MTPRFSSKTLWGVSLCLPTSVSNLYRCGKKIIDNQNFKDDHFEKVQLLEKLKKKIAYCGTGVEGTGIFLS